MSHRLFVLAVFALGCSVDRAPLPDFFSGAGATGGSGGLSGTGGVGAFGGDAGMMGGSGGVSGNGGVGGSGGVSGQGGTGGGCTSTSCNDNVFCNGMETCGSNGQCVPGVAPCASTCDEVLDLCHTNCSNDADLDGYVAVACGGDDCNDANALVYPDAYELCNAVDDNCNGQIDDSLFFVECLAPNITFSVCNNGQCAITSCETDYLDCDQTHSNGCETYEDPTPHDCLKNTCFGIAADATDRPANDGNECTYERCVGTTPETGNVANGTPCEDDEGECDSGFCVLTEG